MGASTSTQYKCLQRNPTRNINTTLTLNEQNHTFCLIQEMEKALAEDQVLKTRIQFTGVIEKINTDIIDERSRRIVKGNPTFKLITTKGKFETRWGDKFFQVKRGTLNLQAPKKQSYYSVTNQSLTNHYENSNDNTITSLDSPESHFSFNVVDKQQNDNRENEVHPWMMSHHQSHDESSNLNNIPLDPKDLYFGGRRRAGSSPGCLTENNLESLQNYYYYKPKPEINVLHNGQFMDELLNCRNIETMNNLLKVDLDEWSASFTEGALDMHLTILSEGANLKYHKPKFEYLWAQLQDESPVLMSLCSLSHDDQLHQLYFPISV